MQKVCLSKNKQDFQKYAELFKNLQEGWSIVEIFARGSERNPKGSILTERFSF